MSPSFRFYLFYFPDECCFTGVWYVMYPVKSHDVPSPGTLEGLGLRILLLIANLEDYTTSACRLQYFFFLAAYDAFKLFHRLVYLPPVFAWIMLGYRPSDASFWEFGSSTTMLLSDLGICVSPSVGLGKLILALHNLAVLEGLSFDTILIRVIWSWQVCHLAVALQGKRSFSTAPCRGAVTYRGS